MRVGTRQRIDPVVLAAFGCIVALLLIGSLYSSNFLSPAYLVQQLQVASFLGVITCRSHVGCPPWPYRSVNPLGSGDGRYDVNRGERLGRNRSGAGYSDRHRVWPWDRSPKWLWRRLSSRALHDFYSCYQCYRPGTDGSPHEWIRPPGSRHRRDAPDRRWPITGRYTQYGLGLADSRPLCGSVPDPIDLRPSRLRHRQLRVGGLPLWC